MDDVPLARRHIRRYLDNDPAFEVIGDCGDGNSAVDMISAAHPELVFLDVQMPELSGFGVLERLEAQLLPAVIFVTAHDEYALRAFEIHALDYLLKPFNRARFETALRHAREQIEMRRRGQRDDRLDALIEDIKAGSRYRSRIAVTTRARTFLIPVDGVDWIEAAGNYACLHVGAKSHLIRETITRLARQLDPQKFARIHRSAIVNIDRVVEITPLLNRDRCVCLQDGTELTMSRTYSDDWDRLFS